ncbi:MAG TPA: hypothetical protein DCX07_06545 [Phycisphaerales bacterium]|nr:hypothetical protein [Phycisphaerales bacterium]
MGQLIQYCKDGTVKIRQSDVATFSAGSEEVHKAYGVTWVTWGHHPRPNPESIEQYAQKVRNHQKAGVHYSGGTGLVTEFRGMIDSDPNFMDSVARDIHGNPRTCPWLTKYLGFDPYVFCHHSSAFKEYVFRNVELAIRAGVDAIHLDDPLLVGPSCYCDRCLGEYKNHLKKNHPREFRKLLGKEGVSDIHELTKEMLLRNGCLKSGLDWRGPLGDAILEPDHFTHSVRAVAVAGKTYSPVELPDTNGVFRFRERFTDKCFFEGYPIVYLFRKLESGIKREIELSYGANGSTRWIVNGNIVQDHVLGRDNAVTFMSPGHNKVKIPLKEGMNLVGVRFVSGQAMDSFFLGELPSGRGLRGAGPWRALGPIRNPMRVEPYDRFMLDSTRDFLQAVFQHARKLAGKSIPTIANAAFSYLGNRWACESVEYASVEIQTDAHTNQCSTSAAFEYKINEALGKRICAMGTGANHNHVRVEKRHNLVRTWIAESYAMGHLFLCPIRLWCYCPDGIVPGYEGPVELFAPVYQFIRKNRKYFDGYESVAKVGILYDYFNPVTDFYHANVYKELCHELCRANIPFRLVVAGKNDEKAARDCESLDAVILPETCRVPDCVRKALESKKIIRWKTIGNVMSKLSSMIHVDAASRIMALPRVKSSGAANKAVIHLLNREYDPVTESMAVKENFAIRMDTSLVNRMNVKSVKLLSPETQDVKLNWSLEKNTISIDIPTLDYWGLVVME